MRRKECIAVLKESPMPTRWMRAYISIYLIALLVQLAALIVSVAALLVLEKDPSTNVIPPMILLGGGLLLLIFTVVTYQSMIRLRPDGFFWCVAHLILSAVYWAVGATLNIVPAYNSAGLEYVPYVVIFLVIYAGGWVAPNYLYFQKRRELFRKYTPGEIAFAKGQWHSL